MAVNEKKEEDRYDGEYRIGMSWVRKEDPGEEMAEEWKIYDSVHIMQFEKGRIHP